MSLPQRLMDEIKALSVATLYFAIWIGMLMAIKTLVLAEYHIAFKGWSLAAVGVVVLAKVVLVLEHVPLGRWVSKQGAWLEVLSRTALYTAGVFVVMVLEKAFESRHVYGGFDNALTDILQHGDAPHIWANLICVTAALLGYNILDVIRRQFGPGGLLKLFLFPIPNGSDDGKPGNKGLNSDHEIIQKGHDT